INYDKNHAFIKMETRAGAARALHGLKMQVSQKGKQNCKITVVRWGVGFGPKNCFDFDSGESLIPLSRLTETDRKWLFTSEKGGTGGRDIVGGIVVEEPDIVIGEGFSSGSGNKKLGPQHESSRKERRRGHDKGDRSSNSSDSRKYSDASWEGSSPRRHTSKWEDAPNDSPFQGTASPPSQEHLTAQQRSRSFSPGLSPRTPDHLPQSEFGNPTLPTQEQLFQQRREQTPQQTHKREYFASHGDTPAREGKKTRWDK
ncbi:20125_t:CDS:2, partial [Gigaspora rosea]